MGLVQRYYHGGAPGLHIGDLIEPQPADAGRHLVEGCPVCEARQQGRPLDYDRNHRFDRVYVTTNRRIARVFAAGYPHGALYSVRPIGDLEPDPEHEESYAVSSARVLAVLDAVVVLRPNEIRRAVEYNRPPWARRLRRAGAF